MSALLCRLFGHRWNYCCKYAYAAGHFWCERCKAKQGRGRACPTDEGCRYCGETLVNDQCPLCDAEVAGQPVVPVQTLNHEGPHDLRPGGFCRCTCLLCGYMDRERGVYVCTCRDCRHWSCHACQMRGTGSPLFATHTCTVDHVKADTPRWNDWGCLLHGPHSPHGGTRSDGTDWTCQGSPPAKGSS